MPRRCLCIPPEGVLYVCGNFLCKRFCIGSRNIFIVAICASHWWQLIISDICQTCWPKGWGRWWDPSLQWSKPLRGLLACTRGLAPLPAGTVAVHSCKFPPSQNLLSLKLFLSWLNLHCFACIHWVGWFYPILVDVQKASSFRIYFLKRPDFFHYGWKGNLKGMEIYWNNEFPHFCDIFMVDCICT